MLKVGCKLKEKIKLTVGHGKEIGIDSNDFNVRSSLEMRYFQRLI